MIPELLITLPDGKTELPAKLIINKMGSSIHLDLKAELSLSNKPKEESEDHLQGKASSRNESSR